MYSKANARDSFLEVVINFSNESNNPICHNKEKKKQIHCFCDRCLSKEKNKLIKFINDKEKKKKDKKEKKNAQMQVVDTQTEAMESLETQTEVVDSQNTQPEKEESEIETKKRKLKNMNKDAAKGQKRTKRSKRNKFGKDLILDK